MRKIFFLFIALSSINAMAQKEDQAEMRVYYNYIHVIDTNFKDKPNTEDMMLVLGKNASVYTSFEKVRQDEMMRKQIEEQIKNSTGGNANIKISKVGLNPISEVDYFYFTSENKLFAKEKVFNNYIVEEPVANFNWEIKSDTATIGGLPCQKAIGNYKGRNWTAWFCTDLPFNAGPWKLNGLPGLVLQAYDSKKEVQFLFTSLEKVEPSKEKLDKKTDDAINTGGVRILFGGGSKDDYMSSTIKIPADAIKTTKKELDRLKQARKDDPVGFMKTQMAGSGITGDIKIQSSTAPKSTITSTPNRPVLNNPIELTEK